MVFSVCAECWVCFSDVFQWIVYSFLHWFTSYNFFFLVLHLLFVFDCVVDSSFDWIGIVFEFELFFLFFIFFTINYFFFFFSNFVSYEIKNFSVCSKAHTRMEKLNRRPSRWTIEGENITWKTQFLVKKYIRAVRVAYARTTMLNAVRATSAIFFFGWVK